MSKISLSPSPTGSAVYTIASPAGSTDRTLNLPDSAGTIATAESTLTQFSASGSAPVFACRAFVNFNGTGTVAIRASGNVSSITDNGTGDYTVNFTTAMPDADYSTVVAYAQDYLVARCVGAQLYQNGTGTEVAPTASTARFVTAGASANYDSKYVCVSIFR